MRRRALFSQMLALNAALAGAAALVAGLIGDLHPLAAIALALAAAVSALIINQLVLRRRFNPLERLIEEMEKVDLSRPGPLLPASIDGVGETEEVERIELAFRRMMRRLEAERRRAGSAALHAQEEERARVARDLHDEVNQSLTGLLLRLEAARAEAPPALEPELAETKALANQAMSELLQLARQLRPTALDDLGLAAAIAGQVEQLGRGELDASFRADGDFSDLGDDPQLVVYRVAQEALSNAARHSGATRVEVALRRREDGGVELRVADDGRGFAFAESERGLGIAGMRERALLVGGELTIESRPGAGTTVRLLVPGEAERGESER
jgi:two-component system, NarL family, sensor histidine kinase UhpB